MSFFVIVAVLGIWEAFHLPLELYPESSSNELTLILRLRGGVAPEDVESKITRAAEEAVAKIPGIASYASCTRLSEANLFLTLQDGADPVGVTFHLQEALRRLKDLLPFEMEPPSLRWHRSDALPVMVVAVAGGAPVNRMASWMNHEIVEQVGSLAGVSDVELWGEAEEEPEAAVAGSAWASRNLSVALVAGEVQEARAAHGSTSLRVHPASLSPVWENLSELSEMQSPLLGPGVRLESIGSVGPRPAKESPILRLNGRPSLALAIFKRANVSSIALSRSVRNLLGRVGSLNHEKIRWEILRDEWHGMRQAMQSLGVSVLCGIFLSAAILFFFGQTRHQILGVLAVIPWCCLVSFLGLGLLRQTLNALSLAGIGFGAGMAVDNSILMSEEVRDLRQKSMHRARSILTAAKRLERPIWASTLTTVIVFLSLLLLDSTRRAFWIGFAVSVAVSLLSSIVVAFMAIPVWLMVGESSSQRTVWLVDRFWIFFSRPIAWAIRHPVSCLGRIFGLGLIGIGFVHALGHQPFVWQDSEFHSFAVEFPVGISAQTLSPVLNSMEDQILKLSGVATVLIQQEPWRARIFIRLKPSAHETAALACVAKSLQKFPQGFAHEEGESGASGLEIPIRFLGESLSQLQMAAVDAAGALAHLRSIEDWKVHFRPYAPEIVVQPNRAALAVRGMTPESLGYEIHGTLRGLRAGRVFDKGESKEVTLRTTWPGSQTAESLKALPICFTGGVVPLESVARVRWRRSPTEIWRQQGVRFVEISGRAKPFQWSSSLKQIARTLGAHPLSSGIRWEFGPSVRDFSRSIQELGWALMLGAGLVLATLIWILRDSRLSFIVLMSVPLGWIGGFWAVWVSQKPLPEGAWVGLLLGSGVAVNHGVVWFETLSHHRTSWNAHGRFRALREILSGMRRHLRALLMTILTSVLAAIPVAFGQGQGSWLWAPLALTYVGSLVGSFLLGALALPSLWLLFNFSQPQLTQRV